MHPGAEPMEVDGHAEVTASLTEQVDKAADASMEVPALDQHTGVLSSLHALSASCHSI